MLSVFIRLRGRLANLRNPARAPLRGACDPLSTWSAALALLLGSAGALLLGEALVRVAGSVLHKVPVVTGHPVMGWTGRPYLNRVTKAYGGGTFRMSTDALGHRVVYPPGQSPAPHAPVVLLVGDSFVQGIGVEDEQTLGFQLAEAMPGRQVIDLGVAGYGTDQELLSVEDFLRTHSNTVSDVVVLTYENDFRDVQNSFDYALARSKPLFRLNRGGLERGAYEQSVLDSMMDVSRFVWLVRTQLNYRFRPQELPADSGVGVVVACLLEIQRIASAHDARFHLFAHRQLGTPYGLPEVSDRVWASFIGSTGAHDITDAIRVGSGLSPIGFDGLHWSAEGTRRAARAILSVTPTLTAPIT